MPLAITSSADFHDAISSPQLVVADFWASWCGPCRMFAPFFDSLAAKHPDVKFIKIQQDGPGAECCSEQGIGAYPTVRFYIKGQQQAEIKGANGGAVEAKVNELKALVVTSFSGSGQSLGGGGAVSSWGRVWAGDACTCT